MWSDGGLAIGYWLLVNQWWQHHKRRNILRLFDTSTILGQDS